MPFWSRSPEPEVEPEPGQAVDGSFRLSFPQGWEWIDISPRSLKTNRAKLGAGTLATIKDELKPHHEHKGVALKLYALATEGDVISVELWVSRIQVGELTFDQMTVIARKTDRPISFRVLSMPAGQFLEQLYTRTIEPRLAQGREGIEAAIVSYGHLRGGGWYKFEFRTAQGRSDLYPTFEAIMGSARFAEPG